MARPRKPTAALERSGAFEKHPERKAARAHEPKPDGPVGEPPKAFLIKYPELGYRDSEQLFEIWCELIMQAPPGVLTISDRVHLELACRLLLRIRKGQAKSGDFNRLESILGKMGMNPADRSKVNVVPTGGQVVNAPSENRYQKIADETAGARPN